MDLPPDFRELLAEFAQGEVEAVLVGGYAVAFDGRPRATKDIDFVLEGSPENLQRASESLARFGAPYVVVEAVRTQAPTDIVFMGLSRPVPKGTIFTGITGNRAADLGCSGLFALEL